MKTTSIYATCSVAFAAALMMTACTARAADAPVPRIQFDNVPLAEAVGILARQAGLNYILDPRGPGSTFGPGRLAPNPLVNARWTNITAQAALSALLKEHRLVIVTNPATTVARIAPANLGVLPMSESQVSTNASKVIPVIRMEDVPLTKAIADLGTAARLQITFAPEISSPAFDSQGTVSFRWERITVRQALAALLDNYDLVMTEDATTATARVALRAKTDRDKSQR